MAAKKDEEKKQDTQAITKQEAPGALAAIDWGEDANAGFDQLDKGDTAIAFLNVLQALSPLVSQEKARPGDYYNTLTEQIWKRDTGFLFVPATTRRIVVQWGPRDSADAGFHGVMQLDDHRWLKAVANAEKFGKNKLGGDGPQKDDTLQETAYLYGIIVNDDLSFDGFGCIPCASTKLGPYRKLMGRLQQILTVNSQGKRERAPLYSHLLRVTAMMPPDVDPKKSYYVPVFGPGRGADHKSSLLTPADEAFFMAKSLKKLIDSDKAKVDYSKQKAQEGDGGEADGDVPF